MRMSDGCLQAGSRALTDVDRTALHVGCWFVIGALIASTALYAEYMHKVLAEKVTWCGNSLTAPLWLILGGGVPVATAAVIGVAILWRLGAVQRQSVVIAATLVAVCTAALIALGAHVYQNLLAGPGLLSDQIWWMTPVWKWFGI